MENNKINLRNKWTKWIVKITNDIQPALLIKYYWKEYNNIINDNPEARTPNDFHTWIRTIYTDSILMAIRRQIRFNKYKKDEYSLLRLLTDMQSNIQKDPRMISLSWYKKRHKYDFASVDFKKISENEKYLKSSTVRKDISKLNKLDINITKYANTFTAHNLIGTKHPKRIPSYNDLDKITEELDNITKKYVLLFLARGFKSLQPTPQNDWQKIFTVPWIKKS